MAKLFARIREAVGVAFGADLPVVRQISGAARHLLNRLRAASPYDAAQTTNNNSRRWQYANDLNANALNSPDFRRILRTRSRYEVRNNSYADGMIQTLVNYVIGTGPRLEVKTEDAELNGKIEKAFNEWITASGFWKKLCLARRTKIEDGEVFIIKAKNPKLKTRIKNDLQLIEPELCTSAVYDLYNVNMADGIEFDDFGNPSKYHFLTRYPGPVGTARVPFETKTIRAENIIHWFRQDKPGQKRGVPEITPALELYSMLRAFTLSVIDAAQTAANFSMLAYTDQAAQTRKVDPFTEFEPERNTLTFLPAGWKMAQPKAEQPATSYSEFKHELLNEIARCLNMPYNIAAANSSDYNYASGQLDHQSFYKFIKTERKEIEDTILNDVFEWFLSAYFLQYGLPRGLDAIDVPVSWVWPGFGMIDPLKEAKAQQVRLENGTTSLQQECAREGTDWETIQDQRLVAEQRERARREELGLESIEETEEAVEAQRIRRAVETVIDERD